MFLLWWLGLSSMGMLYSTLTWINSSGAGILLSNLLNKTMKKTRWYPDHPDLLAQTWLTLASESYKDVIGVGCTISQNTTTSSRSAATSNSTVYLTSTKRTRKLQKYNSFTLEKVLRIIRTNAQTSTLNTSPTSNMSPMTQAKWMIGNLLEKTFQMLVSS